MSLVSIAAVAVVRRTNKTGK